MVDELCAKLKQIQDGEAEAPQTPRPNFALVLRDMHDAHYSGYPSLSAECRVADFVTPNSDPWCNSDSALAGTDTCWLSGSGWSQRPQQDNKDNEEEMLRVLAENHHNVLASLDDELDFFLDAPANNEDPCLARLIAKFDSTVEALWSPDSMILEDNKSPQGEPQAFISSGTNLTSSIWSDTPASEQSVPCSQVVGSKAWADPGKEEDQTALKNAWNTENSNSSWQINYGLGLLSQTILDGENELQQNSLNLINHHREKSGFTEVRKSNAAKTSWSTDPGASKPMNMVSNTDVATDTCQEEDLLTSAKTHFRPIKQNSVEQNVASSQDTVRYEDGTTFAISSSLDKPPFTRSSSGCLYLQASDSPKKYMLYTEKEPFNGKYNTGGFVPKFAVRKSEKGVQTDRDTEDSDSEEDKGFYFPEDEGQFADNIDCPADIEDEGEDDSDTSDEDSSEEGWKCKQDSKAWANHAQQYNVPTWRDAKWCDGEGEVTSGPMGGEAAWFRHLWREGEGEQTKPSSARLREELTEEGEQLFADIQYLQTLFLGDCWAAAVAVAHQQCDLGAHDAEDTSEEDCKGSHRSPEGPPMPPSASNKKWRQKKQQQQQQPQQQSERTYDEITVAPATYLSR
ncbi:hypothetical protein B566_EDAN015909 [Ephemera danica]|nr:hypothetical protein B566_EDAN015909 [Ephemera danica]